MTQEKSNLRCRENPAQVPKSLRQQVGVGESALALRFPELFLRVKEYLVHREVSLLSNNTLLLGRRDRRRSVTGIVDALNLSDPRHHGDTPP
jgi:hypothetical protein